MLAQLLTALWQQESLPLAILSRQTGRTTEETIAGLEQLVRMGYVTREDVGRACGVCSRGSHCDTCLTSGAAGTIPAWYLTEKGKGYIARRKKAER